MLIMDAQFFVQKTLFLNGFFCFHLSYYFQYTSNCTTVSVKDSCRSYSRQTKFEDTPLIKN